MKNWVVGLSLLLLVACSSSIPEVRTDSRFTFTVDPSGGTVDIVATGSGMNAQAVDGQRTLVPGRDLELVSSDYAFLPGNVFVIDAVFKNVSNQTFTNLMFSRAAGSSNIVSSAEPDVVKMLEAGESTGPLRFTVTHKGQPFTYEIEANATVTEPGGTECTDTVNIPDRFLERELHYQLQLSEDSKITCSDLLRLTEFRL